MASEAPSNPSLFGRHWPKLAFSLLMAAGFVWLLQRGALPLVPPPEAFARVDWVGVVLYVGIWSAVHLIRVVRWYFLLAAVQRVPMVTVCRAALVGMAAIVVMPFRMGEVVRPLMIRREGKLTAWAASGTVGAERIVDGLSISALLILSLTLARPVEPLPDHIGDLPIPAKLVPGAAYTTVTVFVAAFTLMGLFYWRRAWARRTTQAVIGLVSTRLATWLASKVEQVADGLGFLTSPRYSLPFFAGTLAYWILNGVSWWFLAHQVGLESLSMLQAWAVMGVLALGILVPNAPGFFGAFQLAVYAGLAMYLPPQEVVGTGSVYVFLTYVLQVGITLILAAVGAVLTPARVEESAAA